MQCKCDAMGEQQPRSENPGSLGLHEQALDRVYKPCSRCDKGGKDRKGVVMYMQILSNLHFGSCEASVCRTISCVMFFYY